ncbi:MAG: hypothetical protein OXE99_07875 [Cellvibrionales bacterium]|nr:hypothetical protein [Cellvibrionales bacterium]
MPPPDIVYDLLNRTPEINMQRRQAMRDNGFHMVYEQSGKVEGFGGLKAIKNDAFIAVKRTE